MIRLFSLLRRPAAWSWPFILVTLATALGACGGNDAPDTPATPAADTSAVDTMTVDRILQTDDRFSTLTASLDSTRLDSLLASQGPYTLFAPPNSAFEALPEGTLGVLMTERLDRLRTILAHHVVERRVDLSTISDTTALVTLAGDSLQLHPSDSTLTVGNAQVLEDGIEGANGLIHVIDAVLLPPEAENE